MAGVLRAGVQLVVLAVEAHGGAPIAGTVTLVNYNPRGGTERATFATNTPFAVTLRSHTLRGVRGNPPEVTFPTLTVQAAGYANADITLDDGVGR